MTEFTFGLGTFGDMSLDDDGNPQSAGRVLRDVVEQAKLADELGIAHFNIGEHHRDDFAITSPDTVLAAISSVTKNITLGSGVTVLSSEDPVRVYQAFATLDGLSNGRAEITAGRGSFIESFPLFGYELHNYGDLFEQKLELLVELLREKPVTWSGSMRAPLNQQEVYPKTERGAIPLLVGVGGSPESVVRAARLGASMALAIIGGDPARFAPFRRLYAESLEKLGRAQLPVSIHSPGHIADTDQQAIEEQWPHYEAMFGRIGRERGWGPTTKMSYIAEVQGGSMYVGSAEKVAKQIVHALRSVGANRFDFKYANGPMPHSKLMHSIELYGTKVVPMARQMLASEDVWV